jgi:hypothetical protein
MAQSHMVITSSCGFYKAQKWIVGEFYMVFSNLLLWWDCMPVTIMKLIVLITLLFMLGIVALFLVEMFDNLVCVEL